MTIAEDVKSLTRKRYSNRPSLMVAYEMFTLAQMCCEGNPVQNLGETIFKFKDGSKLTIGAPTISVRVGKECTIESLYETFGGQK